LRLYRHDLAWLRRCLNLEGVAMAPPQSGIFNMSHFGNLRGFLFLISPQGHCGENQKIVLAP
jgi:hypothetical protein